MHHPLRIAALQKAKESTHYLKDKNQGFLLSISCFATIFLGNAILLQENTSMKTKKRLFTSLALAPLFSIGVTSFLKMLDLMYVQSNDSFTKIFWETGSHFGAPIQIPYHLYNYLRTLPHDKELNEMKKEQKSIQNLIEEFKESVKKEYSL